MGKPARKIPKFASEAEERAFWESHDSTEYVDWSKAQHAELSEWQKSQMASLSNVWGNTDDEVWNDVPLR